MKSVATTVYLILFAIVLDVQAQTPADDDAENLRKYVVELIVFRNNSPYTQEVFSKKDTFGDAVAAYEFLDGEIVEEDDSGLEFGEFETAPLSFLQLEEAVAKINRSADYELLLHTAWVQPGYGRDAALTNELVNKNEFQSSLSGTATLSVSNYLHLDMNLVLEGADLEEYLLREKRKMRRNEAHYFDHPHLGVVAIVRRLENIEKELAEEADSSG